MRRIAIVLGCLISLIAAGGCSHEISGGPTAAGADIGRYRVYYIVTDKADNEIAAALQDDLSARGLQVTSGLDWAIPAEAEVKVLFREKWGSDITHYLQELSIDLLDVESGELLASGRCYRSSIGRRSPPQMVREITERIFPAMPKRAATRLSRR